MMIAPGDLFESTHYPCKCGKSNLEKLNGMLICPKCGFYEKVERKILRDHNLQPDLKIEKYTGTGVEGLFKEIQGMLGPDRRSTNPNYEFYTGE